MKAPSFGKGLGLVALVTVMGAKAYGQENINQRIFDPGARYQIIASKLAGDTILKTAGAADSIAIYRQLGKGFFKDGQNLKALEVYNDLIRLDPDNARNYFERAQVHAEMKNRLDANNDLGKALEKKPDFAEAHSFRGVMLTNSGDYMDAIDCFNKAIELDPRYSPAYIGLIEVYSDYLKNYDKAIETARKWLADDKGNPEAKRDLGNLLKKRQKK